MPRTALGFSSDSSSKDELFHQLVDSITDYAIFVLSPDGHVLTWNLGAEREAEKERERLQQSLKSRPKKLVSASGWNSIRETASDWIHHSMGGQ